MIEKGCLDSIMTRETIQVSPQEGIKLLGQLNANARLIDNAFKVESELGSHGLTISGEQKQIEQAIQVYQRLLEGIRRGADLDQQLVKYLTDTTLTGSQEEASFSPDLICINSKGRPVHSKTSGQKRYIKAIEDNELTFSIGPAGTGKTYLAVAMAVKSFRAQKVSRIILTRPAVEAGEKLGYLPGDLQMKVDPYMRPLYDALYDLMGPEQYQKNLEKGVIEVSPLAYMRGRTLDDSFIILDEAQNTTPEQMKMFLTRIGFHSKAIVTGDITQIDLPNSYNSGLVSVQAILKDVKGIEFVHLNAKDVVRNDLVQRIVIAYEKSKNNQKKNRKKARHD